MKNVSKWLLMVLFALTTTMTYTACNKEKVGDKCEKECCANKDEKCEKDCKKECCNAEAKVEACGHDCKKACCKDKAAKVEGDSSATSEAHVCDEACHTNGCSHKS